MLNELSFFDQRTYSFHICYRRAPWFGSLDSNLLLLCLIMQWWSWFPISTITSQFVSEHIRFRFVLTIPVIITVLLFINGSHFHQWDFIHYKLAPFHTFTSSHKLGLSIWWNWVHLCSSSFLFLYFAYFFPLAHCFTHSLSHSFFQCIHFH